MATTEACFNQFMESIDNSRITTRKMMGEYLLYYDNTVVGGLYDNRLLIKATPSALELNQNCNLVSPYPNAKEMIHYLDWKNTDHIISTFEKIKADLEKNK